MVTYLGPRIPTLGPFLIGQLLAYGPPISLPFLISKDVFPHWHWNICMMRRRIVLWRKH